MFNGPKTKNGPNPRSRANLPRPPAIAASGETLTGQIRAGITPPPRRRRIAYWQG
jgi:hypothetical protein